ncbi:MAG TPA: tRNA pseudouridine(38-40) synthase TruA [Tepidisphaeraceae bacterium]|nr:tRNA pseudouridine(38-40) synthase TruA [Tepidisphaeraceae bacterium]
MVLSYRGSNYHGWQSQPALPSYKGDAPAEGEGIPTIQETLRKAIISVVGHPINLVGASRTDAGVHAKGQFAQFDTEMVQIPLNGMRMAINSRLPSDILVRSIQPMPANYDVIRWVSSKRYQYAIWNAADRPVFFADLAWHRWHALDIDAMQRAAKLFVGEHDFASFARPGHGRTNTVRTIFGCDVSFHRPRLVIGIEGTGFLWNMIRIMVGTLVEIGMGRYAPESITEMLEAKNREAAGPTAPPHGLYLQWIKATDHAPAEQNAEPDGTV